MPAFRWRRSVKFLYFERRLRNHRFGRLWRIRRRDRSCCRLLNNRRNDCGFWLRLVFNLVSSRRVRAHARQLLKALAQLLLVQLHAGDASVKLAPVLFILASGVPAPQRDHRQGDKNNEQGELAARAGHGGDNVRQEQQEQDDEVDHAPLQCSAWGRKDPRTL